MNIDERFEKLEKQNETFAGQIKTLKKMLGGVAALALAALIGGTAMGVHAYTFPISPSKIATKKLTLTNGGGLYLKDSKGAVRLLLSGKNLFLRNSRGKKRMVLSRNGLFLRDSKGKQRVSLDGRIGYLSLHDSSGKQRVRLYGHSGTVKTYNSSGTQTGTLP